MKNRTVLMLLFIICSFFLPTLKFSAQTIPRSPTSNPIPDTDQVQSYTDTFGEDSDYLINQPSYTKLDASGNDLPDSASSWTMVLDNVTGLIWEVKTDDNSIHDKDNTYNWQNAHDVFLAQLNAANFGGFNDWRLPTIKELLNIVYRDSVINTYIPTINLNYFPNCKASYTYSSTSSADTGTGAWAVNFYSGIGEGHQKGEAWYVRAVRGEQAIENNFIINGDGTVTDEATGLMWQQETAGPMKWESALAYCESLNLGGYDDWRLPSINELKSIVDYGVYLPAIDTFAFPGTSSAYYWSSTTVAFTATSYAWSIDFHYGHVYAGQKELSSDYVRAVRSGTPPILSPSGHFFGNVPIGCNIITNFKIKNPSVQNIEIDELLISGESSGDFSVQNDTCAGNTLEQGDTCTFDVAFLPQSIGSKTAQVNITYSALNSKKIILPLTGSVTEVCECDLTADRSCNILDYQKFIQDWGRTDCGTPPGSGNPPNDCECDLRTDGRCNILDYQVFIQDWGRTDCPVCPEP